MILTDGTNKYDITWNYYHPKLKRIRSRFTFMYCFNGKMYYIRQVSHPCTNRVKRKDRIVRYILPQKINKLLPKNIKLYKYEPNTTIKTNS